MMELSSQSKCIKKKHKKKRIKIPDSNDLVPLIKLKGFDGVSNWMKMQKILASKKEEKVKMPVEGKMMKIISNNHVSKKEEKVKKSAEAERMKITGINQSPKKYSSPFNDKKNNHSGNLMDQSTQIVEAQTNGFASDPKGKSNLRTYASMVSGNLSNVNSELEKNLTFNFNESNHMGKGSENETKKKDLYYNNVKLTKAVAMDCEMVGTGSTGEDSIIARVSIVNSNGECLYDEFVKPKEKVTDYRTKISGVRPSDLRKGKDLFEVQKGVSQIIEGRILVGHSLKHDLDVLFLSHPRQSIRDTAYYKPFRDLCGGRTPSLKKLTSKILGCEIQCGEHSSVEDAQAAMLLYLRQKHEWESELKSQRKRRLKINNQSSR